MYIYWQCKNLLYAIVYVMGDTLIRTTVNSQLRVNKKQRFIQNWVKKDYCYTRLISQKTKRKNNAKNIDFIELEKIKKIENLNKIRFFNDSKRKAKSKKARVNNFLVNNIAKKTLKNNKEIAYLYAIALISSKL